MAFVVARNRPLADALRQAALAENRRALRHLAGGSAEDIHQTRKSLKRLRAWLRLLRPQLGERYAVLNALLRDAGRKLAGRRDADVARETLRSLRLGRLLDAGQYALLQRRLSSDPVAAPALAAANDEARSLMEAAQIYFAHVDPGRLDAAVLDEALARSHARCRRRWRAARKNPTPEALHEWRKTVKELATQHALLAQRVTGAQTDTQALKTLGEVLGRHHDHHQLALRLEHLPPAESARLALRLHDALRRRQLQLEADALRRGALLFGRE
ncbi:MAG: CHAD domain-containing protein [Gammaproteobacteria bacterium]